MWIVILALRRPYTFIVMALLIFVLGGLAVSTVSTDILPNVDIPVVNVIWTYTGLSPTDMVNRVTEPRLAYLRLHGRDAKAYLTGKTVAERFDYNYNDRELDEVMGRAQDLARRADEVHVVFNNNARDYAPRAVERLRGKLGQVAGTRGKFKQVDLL